MQLQRACDKLSVKGGSRSRRVCNAVRAGDEGKVHMPVVGLAAMLALSAGLSSGPLLLSAAPAWADDEVELTPFEKRQQESERRRQLLREARERAEQRNQEAASASVSATSQADKAVEAANDQRRAETSRSKLSVQAYDEEAAKGIKAPSNNPYEGSPLNFSLPPPPEKLSDIKVPDFKGFKFEAPSFEAPKLNFQLPKFDTPEPEAPAPAPAPAPKPIVRAAPETPRPVVSKAEAKKVEEAKPGKRRGPLPLAVAELLVLALIGGVAAAATKFNEQSTQALNAAGKIVVQGYNKLETAMAKK